MNVKFVILSCLIGFVHGQVASHEDELRVRLMKNYNPMALPARTTTVTVRFTALHFTMDERMQTLDLDIWVSMEWVDPRLAWSKTDYPDIKKLAFRRKDLWHPDITLYNNAVLGKMDIFESSQILVMEGGHIIWVPPAHAKAACIMDMTYWPHDIHNCSAKFGSWVHSSQTVDLKIKDDYINMKDMELFVGERNLTRGDWNILSTKVEREGKHYDCCPEEYVNVQVTVTLQRGAPAFAWTITMPSVVLCLLTVVVFILPPSSGEKVLLGGIALVLDFFFLLAVSEIIGHSSNHTPLIIKLIGKQLILTGTSIVISGIVLRMIRDPRSSGLPPILKAILMASSTCLCLSGYRQMVSSTIPFMSRSMKGGEDLELNEGGGERGMFKDKSIGGESDWLLFAAVVDRICLIIFIIIFLINMISYSSVL